jgi:hypothetical protein
MAVDYLRLKQMLTLRWVYLAYLFLPTALMVMRISLLSWEYAYITTAMTEFLLLLIYVQIGVTYSPYNEVCVRRAFHHNTD